MLPDWPKSILAYLQLPFDALAVLSGSKNFQTNPVIGNARLNRWGLHIARKKAAHGVANIYRRHIKARLPAGQTAAFDAQGFVQLGNFLPPQAFEALRAELCQAQWSMLEMAQPPALTHRANLDLATCEGRYPALAALLRNELLFDWLRYAAGCPGQPLIALQCIHSAAPNADGKADPQSTWHMDTFHSVGKAWLFLHAVGPSDGPFAYLPGSHRATRPRLAWEQQQSISAHAHPNALHARGSFRASPHDLAEMQLHKTHLATVSANTLVVADTGGLHRRMPSDQPTVRLEIYLTLRRNPYFAWCTPSLLGLPLLRRQWAGMALALFRLRVTIGRPGWIPLPTRELGPEERRKLLLTGGAG